MLVVVVMYQSAAAMTFDPCGAYVYGRHLESRSGDNDNADEAGGGEHYKL